MNAYKCQKCDHTTSRKTSLAQHVKRLHEEVEEDEDPDCPPEDDTDMPQIPAKLAKRSPPPSKLHNECQTIDKCDLSPVTNHKGKEKTLEHAPSVHEEDNVYRCDKCEYTSMWPGNVIKHFNNVHERVRDHRCSHDGCSYATAYRADLVKHMHKLHGASPGQKCKMCDFTSSQRGAIIRHFMKVHDVNKATNQSAATQNWKKTNRSSTEDEESEETGEESDEDQDDIENDMDLDNPSNQDAYGASATNVNNSKYPEDKSGREKMYKCDKCDHTSSRKSSLAQHIARVHEVEEGNDSDQSDEEGGPDSPPQTENLSVKIVGEEGSDSGEAGNVPPKRIRTPLALYNKPNLTKSTNFAIPISLESLGFFEGLCPHTKP